MPLRYSRFVSISPFPFWDRKFYQNCVITLILYHDFLWTVLKYLFLIIIFFVNMRRIYKNDELVLSMVIRKNLLTKKQRTVVMRAKCVSHKKNLNVFLFIWECSEKLVQNSYKYLFLRRSCCFCYKSHN